MSVPLAYGIDFGTTNSSVAVAYPDRVEVLNVGTALPEVLPSIVYMHRNGQRAAGEDAVQQYLVTGSGRTRCSRCDLVDHHLVISNCLQHRVGQGCLDARLPVSIKSELAQMEFRSTHSWAIDFTLEDLVAIVLRELKRRADRICGADVRRVVLGQPVAFVGAEGPDFEERQRTAEDRLQRAAQLAGFEEVVLYDEPAAAVMDEQIDSGLAMAVDFGGGTFDVAIIRFEPDGGEVLALTGAEIGGEQFDKALFEAKVAPALGLNANQDAKGNFVPHWFRNSLSTLGGAMHLLSNPNVPGLIQDFAGKQEGMTTVSNILYGGQTYNFYKAIEEAKIALSTEESTFLDFERPGISIRVQITRSEFEALIAPQISLALERVTAALEQAEVEPDDVNVVLRTGGSSRIPSFISGLEDIFGSNRVSERPVFSTVARGLGTKARMEWAS